MRKDALPAVGALAAAVMLLLFSSPCLGGS